MFKIEFIKYLKWVQLFNGWYFEKGFTLNEELYEMFSTLTVTVAILLVHYEV